MKNLLVSLHNDEAGATATEYVIALILIACTVIAIISTFGKTIKQKFTDAESKVKSDVKIN